MKIVQNSDYHCIPIHYQDTSELRRRKVETSDKSTATINHESTQTDDAVVATSPVINTSSIHDQDLRAIDRLYSNNHHHHTPIIHETDGKKLLLEAYLRNNDNIESNGSCSSSGNKKKSTNSVTGTIRTRESGIGTANDDEVDSIQNDDYFNDKTSDNECKLSVCDEEEKSQAGGVVSTQRSSEKSKAGKKCK